MAGLAQSNGRLTILRLEDTYIDIPSDEFFDSCIKAFKLFEENEKRRANNKEEEPMKTKIITLTINYPETNFDADNIEKYVLEALSGSEDLRDCGGEILDIHDHEPGEEGDA